MLVRGFAVGAGADDINLVLWNCGPNGSGRVVLIDDERRPFARPGILIAARYVPDLPGCVATGASREEAVREISQAIRFHIESLREHNEAGAGTASHGNRCRRGRCCWVNRPREHAASPRVGPGGWRWTKIRT